MSLEEKERKLQQLTANEALLGVAIAVGHFIWWFGFAYGLGGRDPWNYQYILGMPDWLFYSCVLGPVLLLITLWFVVKFVLRDIPLDQEEDR